MVHRQNLSCTCISSKPWLLCSCRVSGRKCQRFVRLVGNKCRSFTSFYTSAQNKDNPLKISKHMENDLIKIMVPEQCLKVFWKSPCFNGKAMEFLLLFSHCQLIQAHLTWRKCWSTKYPVHVIQMMPSGVNVYSSPLKMAIYLSLIYPRNIRWFFIVLLVEGLGCQGSLQVLFSGPSLGNSHRIDGTWAPRHSLQGIWQIIVSKTKMSPYKSQLMIRVLIVFHSRISSENIISARVKIPANRRKKHPKTPLLPQILRENSPAFPGKKNTSMSISRFFQRFRPCPVRLSTSVPGEAVSQQRSQQRMLHSKLEVLPAHLTWRTGRCDHENLPPEWWLFPWNHDFLMVTWNFKSYSLSGCNHQNMEFHKISWWLHKLDGNKMSI